MARLPRAMIAEAARKVDALGLRGSMAPVCPCGTALPTGDAEPASGLCATCDEVEADKQAAHDRHDAAEDARRTAAECAHDAERDDSLEQLLWPVRNRNQYEGREDFEE